MRFKTGVEILGIRPEMVAIFGAIEQAWLEQGVEATITSVTDGKHKRQSAHYTGSAVDVRIWDMDAAKAAEALRERLTGDYDVVLESDHIHVEYDPKL